MNTTSLGAALFIGLTFAATPAFAGEPPPFSDATKESGIEKIVADHYAKVPKWWLSGMDLADVDGDGHLDLVLGAHGQAGLIALNDGKGHFTQVDAPGLDLTEIHVAADVDEDGRLDLQLTHNDGEGRWFFNDSKAGALHFKGAPPAPGQARENALIDLDRDGFVDWIHEKGAGLQVEFGDGHGGFARPQSIPGLKETSAIPVDLNGDGAIDLVLKQDGYNSEHAGKCRLLLNDGKMNFTPATEAAGLVEDGLVIQGVGDVNQDGAIDLICLAQGKTVEIYLNDGAGHFKRLPEAVTTPNFARRPTYANWGLAVVTDFNNDGIPDILMDGRNFLYVLRGTGGGHFIYCNHEWGIEDSAWAAVDEGLCFGDVDGDGDLDIIGSHGTEKRKSVALYLNNYPHEMAGVRQHWLNVRLTGAPGNRCAAGAKIRITEPATGKLLWFEQVVIAGRQSAHSYYMTPVTERHFGLGGKETVDVSVQFYPSGKVVTRKGVKGDGAVELAEVEK